MIENDELLSIIPHRGKMVLLSRVNNYDLKEYSLDAEYDITEDCIFYDPEYGGIPAWVGFEFIAQAISALVGLWRRERGEDVKLGFIMSVSSVKLGLPVYKAGNTVQLKVKRINRMDMVYTFEGFVYLDGSTVLEGKITILDVDEEKMQAFQKENITIG